MLPENPIETCYQFFYVNTSRIKYFHLLSFTNKNNIVIMYFLSYTGRFATRPTYIEGG